jgi:putative selenate reductase molybdopterin-binding subunit
MPERPSFAIVGKSERRVDGRALVTGKPVFVADIALPGTLCVKILGSPYAHARILSIDASEAETIAGVACVLTHENTPSTRHTTAGQGFPEPSPYDTRMFENKVRFVGDRVAAVAADSEEIAVAALKAIRVEYEELEPVLSIDEALREGAPVVHDEADSTGIYDALRNIVADVDIDVGDVDAGFEKSDVIVEVTCETQYAQHAPIETHVVYSHLDSDGRLVLRTSTQVPFHVRRIVAQTLGISIRNIRVIKPRVGGGFGAKQEVLLEDIAGLVTLRTGRPALVRLTRKEEFTSARTRHPMRVRVRLGAGKDNGILRAIEMEAISNTGAYGAHGLTVLANTGSKTLPLYNKAPNAHFYGQAIYTTLPVPGAYRGYGATQGYFPLETAMDELAERLGIDPIELRRRNHIRVGETSPIFEKLGEGREGVEQTVKSCELERCLEVGAERIGWAQKRGKRIREGPWVHGLGMSIMMQGSGIPLIDMAAATMKMNEDGSFNLLVGATDIGTGSDTILAQIAAEVLGVPLEKMLVTSSDTDFTPFDVGAYASSTSGGEDPRSDLRGRRPGSRKRGERTESGRSVGRRAQREEAVPRAGLPAGDVRVGPVSDRCDGVVCPDRIAAAVPRQLRRSRRGHRDRPRQSFALRRRSRLWCGDQPRNGRGANGGRDRQRDWLRADREDADQLARAGPESVAVRLQDPGRARYAEDRGSPRRFLRADGADGREVSRRDRNQRSDPHDCERRLRCCRCTAP